MPQKKGKSPKKTQTRDNRITNRLVRSGRLPKSQAEVFPQFEAGSRSGVGRLEKMEQMTRDNKITNRMVKRGVLPKSQEEIYPQ